MHLILPLLFAAGLAQIGIALAGLGIPRVLGWREETERLSPLNRHVFWTYAGYILATNLALGALSSAAPHLLLDGSALARCVAGYAACYWGVRLALQLTAYERARPRGVGYAFAAVAFGIVFGYLALVYGAIAFGFGAPTEP